ncbi:MAG: DUF4198 domain-containing protein [Vicinamibacterales bacterium]
MKLKILALTVSVLLGRTQLDAHDFWLAAAPWQPAEGAPIVVTGNVGEKFPVATHLPAIDRVDAWRVISATGDVSLGNEFYQEGKSLATDVPLSAAGAYLGVMTVEPRMIEMKGPAFTEYLREEGLHRVITERQAAGEADRPARELYAGYAKVAIRNGSGGATHLTRPVGLKAEFVPTTDPTTLHAGQSLTLQLLIDGTPVADAEITAVAEDSSVKGQTDANGRVTLTIDREGAWLVKTVHMARLPQSQSAEANWESSWVTFTFHTAHQ